MSAWQPIETAPRDVNILVLSFVHIEDYDASITVGFWCDCGAYGDNPRSFWADWCAGMTEEFGEGDDAHEEWARIVAPTHWMPLPQPPEPTS